MSDINERAKDAWRAETTARERITETLKVTTEYASASAIAERALTSEPTARTHLRDLVDEGIGVTKQEGRTTLYKRSDTQQVDERIAELRRTATRDELVESIQELKEELAAYRDQYDAEGPEELAVSLEAGDEGWGDVGRWRTTRRNLAIAQAALQVKEAHRLAEV